MCDKLLMLEGALNLMDEGIAFVDAESNITFWNTAATRLTGYHFEEMLDTQRRGSFYCVDVEHASATRSLAFNLPHSHDLNAANEVNARSAGCTAEVAELDQAEDAGQVLLPPVLITLKHKLGHAIPGMLRKGLLRDGLGVPAGEVLLFYPVEEAVSLPHGDCGESRIIERSQADMEDRLDAAHHQWLTSHIAFGLLWITVDQASDLRKTHGNDACEAMMHTVEQTLLRQLKPSEIIGRWGTDEYLMLSHERTAEPLLERGRRLAGLARTADFRWWGDRVALTVSIGAHQAAAGDSLQSILQGARNAMHTSEYAGGNRVTGSRGA